MKSWFAGTASSVNSEIITPFSNAEQIIYKYNQAIEHNSLTQQGWQRLIAQCDDGLASYLTNIKGSTASMSAYSVSLQGNITGYTKITQAMKQYNALGAVSQKEQQNFATAVALTNTKLGSYLTGLNGAKASLSGYGILLIASTAKTVGLTIATTALNAALTFGISAIVTGVISAFATWINSSKKITEAAEEAKDKISSINDDLKTNTETVENAKQRYAELAQEVENLGKVSQSQGSLSTDEYKEFLDLSNQLAGVFPQLTKGYDDNGNAILDLFGSVDTIVGSLDDLLQKEKDLANQKIMDEFPDVYKGYIKDLGEAQSEVKSAKAEFDKVNNAYQQLQNSGGAAQAFDLQGNGTFKNADGEQVKVTLAEYEQALKDLGIEYEKTNIMVKNQFGGDTLSGFLINATGDIDTAFTNKLETAKKNLDYAKQQLEGKTSSISSYLNTWLQTEFTYNQIDDAGLQTAVQDMIMNFDFSNLPENVDKDNWNEVSEYLRRNILFAINDAQDDPDISKAISEVFTNQDLTPDEKADYLKQIKDYFDNELGKDNAISISLQPQIDDTDALQKNYQKTLERFKFDTSDSSSKELDSLNKQLDEQTQGLTDAKENLQNEYDKISDWGLDDYADQIKNNTIQTKFGNVDMDKRTIIHWSDELKQTYADALASWDYDPEVGSIDTVFGGSERFGEELNGNGWEVVFTPILPDGTFLSKDTVEEYINSILEEAYADDGKVSEDELTAIDAQGRQVGNTFVQGIFAGIDDSQNYDNNGNWAETVGRLMHFSGKFGAKQLADQGIDDANAKLEETKKKIEEVSKGFDDSQKIKDFFDTEGINTDEEIDEFNKVTEGINRADEAIQKWNEHKKEGNETPISFTDRLAKVQALSDGLDQLDKIYTDVLDGGDFDYSSILGNKDFTNTFSTYTAEYENFIKTISNSPTDINACQQAFNDLATAYIYNSNALKDVTDETKESTIAMLEQMGVQNAAIIVEQSLAANKILAKLDTIDFTNATKEEILALVEEENKVHNTNFSLSQLLAIKSNLNSLKIDTASDIEQLIALANAAGAAYMRIQQLENLKDVMTNNGVSTREKDLNLNRGGQMTVDEKRAQDTYNKLQDGSFWNADIGWMDLDASNYIKPVNYNGGSATDKIRDKKDKGSKDKAKEQEKAKEQTTQTFDFIETRIDRLESKISKFQKRAEDAKRSFSSRIYNYKKEISTLFSELKTQNKAYNRYMQKANSVGLSEEWKKKVRNGAISIKDVKDDALKEQIESYQTWYEKAKKAKDATDDLTRSIQDEYEALAKLNSEYAESKVEKYSSSIDLLEAKKENYVKYQSKNNMLSKESSYLDKELSAYQKAYRNDKTELNSAKKSINRTKTTKANKSILKNIKSCVNSGKEISSSTLSKALSIDSGLYNKCLKYNAYLAAYETDKATYDLQKQENISKKADLAQEKLDNIDTYYSNRRQGYEQRANELNSAIDINEAKGYQISTKYYSRLISEEKKNNASLVEERKKLVKSLADSLKNGSVKSGSEEWYEMSKQIDDVTNAIDESTKSLVEYNNQLRQIKWDNFDYLEERIKTVTSEVDFMINELSREDLTSDDIGDFTDRGKAVAYLHASNYTSYIQQAKDYEKEVSKIEKELTKDPYNKTLISRKEELVKSYEDSISAAQDEKYAIIDLYTQGYEALKNRISDLISEYEKLMDAEKNAYDWQNTISEKTKQIADLRKQLIAYSGDVSEETRSKIQSLNVSLKDAEKDLRESEYDKLISDTKDMLSDLQDNFDDVIQDVIDSLSENFKELLDGISKTSNSAVATIKGEMNGIGYTPTDEFKEILNGTNVVTTTQNLIDTIKDFQTKMTEYANLLANSTSTTTGGQSVKDKIRSDGENTLSKAISDSNSKLSYFKGLKNNAKISRDEAKANRDSLKKQYEDYIKTHSKNSTKAKELKSKYNIANSKYNELNKSYNVQNDIYKNMKKQNNALNYLKSHLNTTDSSRDKLSDLNKALYDKYGQRVLSETEMKELAEIVGVKFDNKNKTGNLYKKLKDLGIPGFKVGSRNIPKDMIALLGEAGNELHFSKEQGVLREVGQGDKVFTNEQAQNLWKLSQLTPVDWSKNLKLNSLNIPQADRTTTTIVEVGDIVMQGVNDVETFGKQLREEICKGGKTTKCITEAISSTQLGKGIGKAKLYK